jgi:hypothetical protein
MAEVTIIGIDLAKCVFQLQGASEDGSVVFRKKLSRGQVLGEILPVLTARDCRTHAAIFSFMAGVTPPMPMLGRSLL